MSLSWDPVAGNRLQVPGPGDPESVPDATERLPAFNFPREGRPNAPCDNFPREGRPSRETEEASERLESEIAEGGPGQLASPHPPVAGDPVRRVSACQVPGPGDNAHTHSDDDNIDNRLPSDRAVPPMAQETVYAIDSICRQNFEHPDGRHDGGCNPAWSPKPEATTIPAGISTGGWQPAGTGEWVESMQRFEATPMGHPWKHHPREFRCIDFGFCKALPA